MTSLFLALLQNMMAFKYAFLGHKGLSEVVVQGYP